MEPLLCFKENMDAPYSNIIIIQDNEPYKPVHYQSKSYKCHSKEVCDFWPQRTKGKSNDSSSLYLPSIMQCITNDAIIVDNVILTGYQGKVVGEVSRCFDYCCEK